MALIRIPEVIQKIREVQEILDQSQVDMDLSNFIGSDDSVFLKHYRKKEFAGIVVQLGLFERYKRKGDAPENLVGVTNSISAVRVLSGEITLQQLVEEAFKKSAPKKDEANLPGIPVLTGIQIPKFKQFKLVEGNYVPYGDERVDLKNVLDPLEKQDLVYEVGLGSSGLKGTIENDSQLSWFFDQLGRENGVAAVN